MMIAMIAAGMVTVLAGLLATLYGIQIKEFGFGNTLIETGILGVCTGMILLGLSVVVAELKVIARRLVEFWPAGMWRRRVGRRAVVRWPSSSSRSPSRLASAGDWCSLSSVMPSLCPRESNVTRVEVAAARG